MINYLEILRNICQYLEEYSKTNSNRNGRVRSLNDYQSCWKTSCKSHPSISNISLFFSMIWMGEWQYDYHY